MKLPLVFSILFISSLANSTPLSALLTYDTKIISTEGVTKTTHFQEVFVRDNNNVWSQRILPPHTQKQDQTEHNHEHNLNFALAGKWLSKTKDNHVTYKLARPHEKTIIEPRTNEYATLGFDGDWDAAYYLVKPSIIAKLKKIDRKSAAGTQWYIEEKNGSKFSVLWDAQRQFPLVIENASIDGTSTTTITIKLQPNPTSFPWSNLSGYQTTAYEDLLD